MKEAPLGPTFTEIVLEVFKLSGLLVNQGDQIGAEFGISSARWKVLGAVALAGEAQTVAQIARTMGLTRQAVQRLVDAMHDDGFVDFQINPDHKRAKLITLSTLGKKSYAKLDEKQQRWANQCCSGMLKKELETTLATLKKISNSLDQ